MAKIGPGRSLALKALNMVMLGVMMPLIRWIGKESFAVPPVPGPGAPTGPAEYGPTGYVAAAAHINPIVVARARDDMAQALAKDPEGQQAELNACMESIRSEPIKKGLLAMFGSLIAKGHPPDEAIARVCANFLLMGLFLERRIHPVELQDEMYDA